MGIIYYLEGQFKQSILSHMNAHKWIKNILLWEQSAIETTRSLKKLKQFSDIKAFLNKMQTVVQDISN